MKRSKGHHPGHHFLQSICRTMKILKQVINDKTSSGFVVVQAEEEDDMYHLFNLICVGDEVEATSMRNVVTESQSGSRNKSRVVTKITIQVENIDFDAEQCSLRLKGTNVKENEHLKLGQYHTLTLEMNRPCEIKKERWDSINLEMLSDLMEPTKGAELAMVVMQEGLANVYVVKAALTKNCAKIERTLPKKRQQGNQAYDTAVAKFYGDIFEAVKKHINFEVVKVVLVGSPGFLNEEFLRYMQERAVREECTVLIKNKAKFVKAHTSCGHKRAVEELLGNPELAAQVGDVKAAGEARALQTFYAMLSADPDRACYGVEQVMRAAEQLAVEELLITDTMYRASDFAVRNRFVQLIEAVKLSGGRVFQFSSLHCTGEQLNMYTGIAATLRFPLPEVDEDDDAAGGSGKGGQGEGESSDDEVDALFRANGGTDYDDIADYN